jgi:hypothetical protein
MSGVPTEPYAAQAARWPASGRHILAHFDAATVVVYQAYKPSIARYALEHGRFGGPEFGFGRMSWIKPNFLWMMYRSSWASAEGQEMVLGLRIARTFFDGILAQAVPSSFDPDQHSTREEWQQAVARSEVRLQWDPDHDPTGAKLERRAIQLGLRGNTLREFATTELIEVIDMTPLAAAQREYARREHWASLRTPTEGVYVPEAVGAAAAVRLDKPS